MYHRGNWLFFVGPLLLLLSFLELGSAEFSSYASIGLKIGLWLIVLVVYPLQVRKLAGRMSALEDSLESH